MPRVFPWSLGLLLWKVGTVLTAVPIHKEHEVIKGEELARGRCPEVGGGGRERAVRGTWGRGGSGAGCQGAGCQGAGSRASCRLQAVSLCALRLSLCTLPPCSPALGTVPGSSGPPLEGGRAPFHHVCSQGSGFVGQQKV